MSIFQDIEETFQFESKYSKYFLKNGSTQVFYQINCQKIPAISSQKITTHRCKFKHTRLSFGGGKIQQHLSDNIKQTPLWVKKCICLYRQQNNIWWCLNTHQTILCHIFDIITTNNIIINTLKSHFFKAKLKYLSYEFGNGRYIHDVISNFRYA